MALIFWWTTFLIKIYHTYLFTLHNARFYFCFYNVFCTVVFLDTLKEESQRLYAFQILVLLYFI